MKLSYRMMRILSKKIKYHHYLNQFFGYLTPVEILYLSGQVVRRCEPFRTTRVETLVKDGNMFSSYFYFTDFKKDSELLRFFPDINKTNSAES